MNDLASPPAIDLLQTLRVFVRRKWLLIAPWALATVVGGVLAFTLPPVYTSAVTLMFTKPTQLTGKLGDVPAGPVSAEAQADVMREQVKSSLFLTGVITATGMRTDPWTHAWALKSAGRYPGASQDEAIELFLTDFLKQAIEIRKMRGNVIQIIVSDRDRDRARMIADGVANQFIASSKAAQIEAVQATQEFSLEQQRHYQRELQAAEQKLEAYRRGHMASSGLGTSVGSTNVARASQALSQAEFEGEDLRDRVRSLRSGWSGKARDRDPEQLSSGQTNQLASQMVALERQLAAAQLNDPATGGTENLGSLRLGIVRKRNELEIELGMNANRALPNLTEDVKQALVAFRLAQADLAGVDARRQWLQGQVAAYQGSVMSAPAEQLEEQRLVQELENTRTLYNSFVQQSAIASIAEAFENAKLSGKFELIQPATRPLSPSKPNRPVLLLLATMAGLVVGAGTVLLVEHHDQSVKNADEIEDMLELPVLGAIPRVAELERSRRRRRPGGGSAKSGLPPARDQGLLHRLKVESPLGLEFRRTHLKLSRLRGREMPRTLLITSATRGEGKTTTTACLAITLARELRQKVLLVDFDLRSPALHRALGLPSSSWGLAQMLNHRHFDERFIRATVLPDLEFLPAGRSERPASELVDSETCEWFVREASQRYPMVVIDCPPNLAVPDALILGRMVDGVIYVIKAGSTIRKAAEYGVRVQRESRENVLGVLVNDSGEVLPHYYGYRYNYYGMTEEAAGTDA
jgi:capsular exopolysaccharide synthesis family protein